MAAIELALASGTLPLKEVTASDTLSSLGTCIAYVRTATAANALGLPPIGAYGPVMIFLPPGTQSSGSAYWLPNLGAQMMYRTRMTNGVWEPWSAS